MSDIQIVPMTEAMIPLVTEAGMEFWRESNFDCDNLTVRPDKYEQLLKTYLPSPYAQTFIAMDGDKLAGYIHIYCQNDFTTEMIGEMYQFYVRAEYRGKGVGRMLVAAADRKYQEWGCARAFTEVGHGGEGHRFLGARIFVNLWKKFGFKEIGHVMLKEYE